MTVQGPTILLQSGKYFSFLEPEKFEFSILDIAHGLSNLCRFAGQTKNFYSVAEHSVHCSYLVPEAHAMEGLMHDAAEACYDNCPARLRRQQILDLRRQGLSYSRIAELLGLASASVGTICKQLDYLEEDIAANNAAGSRFKTGFDPRRNRGFQQQ